MRRPAEEEEQIETGRLRMNKCWWKRKEEKKKDMGVDNLHVSVFFSWGEEGGGVYLENPR